MSNAAINLEEHKMDKDLIGDQRGLNYDVSLLWEYPQSDASGVDLPEVKKFENRTGQEVRENIGLASLKEPQVLRHYVRLSTKNYGIDNGFFPLGSCTMKHNPRLNEKMARLPGFAHVHPLQPESTIQGALALMYDLQNILGELTGLAAVTLAPAAGAHGELAGMMTIRRAHEVAGENEQRRFVLCPDSAHGTNPATAVTCGYQIRVIDTKGTGCISVDAFKEALYAGTPDGSDVAGMMVTNPNTCGLFETDISEVVELLHQAGGYFYCDGANFNALVGTIRPGDFGVDVMHLNLHKTFSTPHGGGGPGSGPICCAERLRPFMPIPVVDKGEQGYTLVTDNPESLGRLKGFHGQFGMHVRALTYILSHGADGLQQVSQDAVLSANYILSQLKEDYHVPYEGPCMHECLITDKLQKEKGVSTLDIAKGLVEYGIHPMTVYFPLTVSGTMLIEPTETESKEEIDRFIALMKFFAAEVKEGRTEQFHDYPLSVPKRRLDEVHAARNPKLRWESK